MTGIVSRFHERLPKDLLKHAVSLHEGDTPLIELNRLPSTVGLPNLKVFCKFEGLNPTGSFKDRGMAAAVSNAVAQKARMIICASTGNTSASAGAYAARANLACTVLIPKGKIAAGKIAQAIVHGCHIIEVQGNFDSAMQLINDIDKVDKDIAVVNSTNLMRIQGQKTAAFEVIEVLKDAPDYHALPVGNAGNITSHWIGYSEAANQPTNCCKFCKGKCPFKTKQKLTSKLPKMLGYQAEGSAPFLKDAPIDNPETIATAIRIGRPQSWTQAKIAIHESSGHFKAVSDQAILSIQKQLAETEGLFCEPASAASLAGVIADAKENIISNSSVVVCTLTGHGLKDISSISQVGSHQVIKDSEKLLSTLKSIIGSS